MAVIALAMGSLSLASAQNLVVFDAESLVADKSKPHIVVLQQEDYDSPEFYSLMEKIERYGVSRAFEGENNGSGDSDWDEYVAELEAAIAELTSAGDHETAKMFRQTLEQAKRERSETEALFRDAFAETKALGEGLDGDKLRAEVLKYAVGGRFYFSAEIYFDRLACVMARPNDNEDNVYGLLDANGKMVLPASYWAIFMREWPNACGKGLIVTYRMISDDRFEASLFWEDGSPASQQTFAAAKIFDDTRVIGVRFQDGGWGLMNADARVITHRRYKKFDWNTNDLIDSSKGNFVYGERDGVNYIISPVDGSEIGTFKSYTDARGVYHHDVNYY